MVPWPGPESTDAPPVAFEHLLDERQSDAAAGLVGLAINPLEHAKDDLMKFGIDADSVVADIEYFFSTRSGVATRPGEIQSPPARRALSSHFTALVIRLRNTSVTRVYADDSRQGPGHRDPRLLLDQQYLHHHFDFVDDDIQIGVLHRKIAMSEPGIIQEIVDQPFHALAELSEPVQPRTPSASSLS